MPVKRGETILSAICRAGMTYNYGCRRGGCGICTATVRSGSTSYEGKTVAGSVLSAEKRAEGVVLTCRAVPVSDVEPLIVPTVAWIVVVPSPTPVAVPAVEIVATLVAVELQVALAVIFPCVPSE